MKQTDKINILWTTGDKTTALTMLAVYVLNAKSRGWWKEINVIIWGEACRDCSDVCGVTGDLERLGINVRFMGIPLTDYIKSDEPVLTI
jgi:hypothetical protein